jgi:hypothetical protein
LDRNSMCARYVVVEPLSFTRFVRKTSPTVCPMHPNPSLANHFGGALNSKSVLKCAKCTQCIHTSSTTRFKMQMSTVFPLPFLPKAHPWHPSPKAAWYPISRVSPRLLPSRLLPPPPHPSFIPVSATWHLLGPREPFLSSIPGSKEARTPEKPGVFTCFPKPSKPSKV